MIVSKVFPKVIILFSISVQINKNKLVDAPVCRQQTEGQILGISYKKPATILCEVKTHLNAGWLHFWVVAIYNWNILHYHYIIIILSFLHRWEGQQRKIITDRLEIKKKVKLIFPFVVQNAISNCYLIEHLNKPMIKPTNI